MRLEESASWPLLLAVATWRLTTMLCHERGPFGAFVELRRLLIHIGLARVIVCFHCTAVWIAASLVAAFHEWRPGSFIVFLAAAGGASIIERFLDRDASELEADDG
jgi:hypothetical protein